MFRTIYSVTDAILVAAEALKPTEDRLQRPRILEALSIAMLGKNEAEFIAGLLFVVLNTGRIKLGPLNAFVANEEIKEALRQLNLPDIVEHTDRYGYCIKHMKECTVSPSRRNRMGALLASRVLDNVFTAQEKQLAKDIEFLSNEPEDKGNKLLLSVLHSALKEVQYGKERIVDAFGKE